MRDNLYGLAEISTFTFLVYDCEIYFSGSDVIGLCHMNTQEPLIMSEVQVRLCTVIRHIALAMLVRVQCSRVNVDVGIKFLNGYSKSSGL